jgi:hypothetical protein
MSTIGTTVVLLIAHIAPPIMAALMSVREEKGRGGGGGTRTDRIDRIGTYNKHHDNTHKQYGVALNLRGAAAAVRK